VSHCVTVWQIHRCHFCETRHTCHKYQYHVTLVIKCVKEGVLVTDFNKVLGGGDKSDSKAFGDYFVVSRRQKGADWVALLATVVCFFRIWRGQFVFPSCACLESVFLPFLLGQSSCILLQDHLDEALVCIGWTCHLGPFWGITANLCLHSSTHTKDAKASAITTCATAPPLISFPL
jgi:hypothetical protein